MGEEEEGGGGGGGGGGQGEREEEGKDDENEKEKEERENEEIGIGEEGPEVRPELVRQRGRFDQRPKIRSKIYITFYGGKGDIQEGGEERRGEERRGEKRRGEERRGKEREEEGPVYSRVLSGEGGEADALALLEQNSIEIQTSIHINNNTTFLIEKSSPRYLHKGKDVVEVGRRRARGPVSTRTHPKRKRDHVNNNKIIIITR